MKVELHIPVEQYGFIALQAEDLSAEATAGIYREYSQAFKPQAGLSVKEFNACVDRYLTDGTGETEKYMAMSPAQKETIQCIKRAYKRLEGKDKTKYEGLDSKDL